jgi:hypothetical protein
MSLSPIEAEEQRIEANGAVQAVLLNLRMKGCRLRIIPIILSFRGSQKAPAPATNCAAEERSPARR